LEKQNKLPNLERQFLMAEFDAANILVVSILIISDSHFQGSFKVPMLILENTARHEK